VSLSVCPVATIAASIERVWTLLEDPAKYGHWTDGTVDSIEPTGLAQDGQVFTMSASALGKRWPVRFEIDHVDSERHQIAFRVALPFGIEERSVITCTSLDARTCRVSYG
jgi:hypothetical protein